MEGRWRSSPLPLPSRAIPQPSDATLRCSKLSISSGLAKYQTRGTEVERWSRESPARSSYRQPFKRRRLAAGIVVG